MQDQARIAVMVSGGGTNLQALIDAQNSGVIASGRIVYVLSSQESAYALTRARAAGIECGYLSKKELGSQVAWDAAAIEILDAQQPDLIVMAGFLSILSDTFINHFAGRMINIHPAYLPAFGGPGMYGLHVHEAVLAAGVKTTGATVHYVTLQVDSGAIISQKEVPVMPGDTPEILQRRVMEQAEWVLLPQATEQLCAQIVANRQTK